MSKIALTAIECLILVALSFGLGLGVNTIRGKDSIDLNRDYHPKIVVDRSEEQPFQTVTFDEVVKIWEDPSFMTGLYVFVDARNDSAFGRGHIPGAVQCDYYRIEHYMDNVVPAVLGAEKVVVYCSGVECEDSLFVCGKLIELEVPREGIYLYKAGWHEWNQKGMPVEKGLK